MSHEDMSYEDMSLSQLEKEKEELAAQKAAVRECQAVVAALIDEKVSAAEAQRKVEAMSEPERAALLQVLQPEGIESVESVNG